MTVLRKGLFIELVNRSTNRVIFTAATDELEKPTFDELWKAIGDSVYKGAMTDKNRMVNYYELRVTPMAEPV